MREIPRFNWDGKGQNPEGRFTYYSEVEALQRELAIWQAMFEEAYNTIQEFTSRLQGLEGRIDDILDQVQAGRSGTLPREPGKG